MACTGSTVETDYLNQRNALTLKKSPIMWRKLLANHSASKSNNASYSKLLLISLKQHQKTLLQSEYSCK